MADFEVAYANDVLTPYSGDAARYEINPQSGVLTVFDGDGQRFHFSPRAGSASGTKPRQRLRDPRTDNRLAPDGRVPVGHASQPPRQSQT